MSSSKQLILSARVYGIDKIDTIAMTFDIDWRVFVAFKTPPEDADWEPELGTHVLFQNCIGEIKVIDSAPSSQSRNFEGFKRKNWRVKLTVSHNFTLFNFPVDIQQLPVLVRIPRVKENGIQFVSIASDECRIQTFGKMQHSWNFIKLDTCMLLDHLGMKERVKDPREFDLFTTKSKSEFAFVITVQRRFSYYVANIAIPNSLLVSTNFSIFCIEYVDIASRMQIILTILLTAVAFKFSVASLLPVLSYQTALDSFCLGLLAFVLISALESIIISKMPYNTANIIDHITVAVLAVTFVVYHVWWTVWLLKNRVPSESLKEDQDWAQLVFEDSKCLPSVGTEVSNALQSDKE